MTDIVFNKYSIINRLISEDISFEGEVVFVTGSTGLIGKSIVNCLLELNKDILVIAQGRDIEKLKKIFINYRNDRRLILYPHSLKNEIIIDQPITYVIHAASPTSSKYFIEQPIDVLDFIYQSTLNLLKLSEIKKDSIKTFLLLSTMEVYGEIHTEKSLSEKEYGLLNFSQLRSSYPQAKRTAELLCLSYFKTKDTPIKICRLAMIFGPGMETDDERVLNYFFQSMLSKKDIVLKTTGQSKTSLVDIDDAVSGIFHILLKGENGEVYNLANPNNYMSIYSIASIVAEMAGVNVLISTGTEGEVRQFRPDNTLNLSIENLLKTGWYPFHSVKSIFTKAVP